jgi:hypothetical protein
LIEPPVPSEVRGPAVPPELFAPPPAPDRVDVVAPPDPIAPPDADAPPELMVLMDPPEPAGSDGPGLDFPQPSTTNGMVANARSILNRVVGLVVCVAWVVTDWLVTEGLLARGGVRLIRETDYLPYTLTMLF